MLLRRLIVIVCCGVFLTGWNGNSQLFAQQGERIPHREVTVNALGYGKKGGKAFGGCFPVRVSVGGTYEGRVRVGFFESEVGGSGGQWQAAGWMASVMAAQLTDFDPATMQVAFEVQGFVDGPSAGALMTVGILAAVRGDTVRADAAMTGTINPDGMVGPVSGIPHKIEGAAAKGIKLVVIPVTSEAQLDENSNEFVNLIRHGKELGVTVKSVVDIYEAYELMTGVALPRAPAKGRPRVALKVDKILTKRMVTWTTLINDAIAEYQQTPDIARIDFNNNMITTGQSLIKSSEQLLREGVVTAAYGDLVDAAMNVFIAKEVAHSRQTLNGYGLDGMVNRIKDNGWLQSEIEKTATALRFSKPTTLNQLALYFYSCDAFIEAIAFQKLAANMLANLPEDQDKRAEVALTASGWQVYAWLDCLVAMDGMEVMQQYGGKPIPADAPFLETAKFYRRASDASLTVFDSITISEIAQALKVGKSTAATLLSRKDPYYALMRTAQSEVIGSLPEYFGDGPQLTYATVAAAIYLHMRSSMLIAKYYSLGAELDKDMVITRISREQTFNDWLAASDDQARRNIMLLSKYGIDTSTFAQTYEYSRILRNRGMNEKLESLGLYFYINITTKIMQRLSGVKVEPGSSNAAPVAPPSGISNSPLKPSNGDVAPDRLPE